MQQAQGPGPGDTASAHLPPVSGLPLHHGRRRGGRGCLTVNRGQGCSQLVVA